MDGAIGPVARGARGTCLRGLPLACRTAVRGVDRISGHGSANHPGLLARGARCAARRDGARCARGDPGSPRGTRSHPSQRSLSHSSCPVRAARGAAFLTMSVLDRFLRYVAIDTRADENSTTCPSTPGQLTLLRLLADELRAIGLSDVALDANGYL